MFDNALHLAQCRQTSLEHGTMKPYPVRNVYLPETHASHGLDAIWRLKPMIYPVRISRRLEFLPATVSNGSVQPPIASSSIGRKATRRREVAVDEGRSWVLTMTISTNEHPFPRHYPAALTLKSVCDLSNSASSIFLYAAIIGFK